jgi:hypothetical protein
LRVPANDAGASQVDGAAKGAWVPPLSLDTEAEAPAWVDAWKDA